MVKYISTTDTAKLLRLELKNRLPGVKFSVRKGAGTASGWLNVSWTDGPEYAHVREVADQFRGEQFNGQTDNYDQLDTPYLVSGITYNRHITDAPTPQFIDPDAPGYVF